MRELLARAAWWLRGLGSKERHRRMTAEALVGKHRPDLSRADAAEVEAFESLAHVWRTGEQPIVSFDHAAPIGPAEEVLPATLFTDVVEYQARAGALSDSTGELLGLTAELRMADVRDKLARGKAALERAR